MIININESMVVIIKKYNQYDLSGEYGIGWTSNTNQEFYFDLEDYDKIKDYTWREDNSGITQTLKTRYNKTIITMHQLLGYDNCDHINRNELDNRKNNLRKCTHQENCCNRRRRSDNTTGFVGVYKVKKTDKWRAQIFSNGKTYYGPSRDTFEDAKIDRLYLEAKYMHEFSPNIDLFDKYNIQITNDSATFECLLYRTNTSGCTGVCWSKDKKKWKVWITIDKKAKHIGYFIDIYDAIQARLKAEVKYYGEFAPQRHLFEQYGITIQNELEEKNEL